jgi:hypothetical protein
LQFLSGHFQRFHWPLPRLQKENCPRAKEICPYGGNHDFDGFVVAAHNLFCGVQLRGQNFKLSHYRILLDQRPGFRRAGNPARSSGFSCPRRIGAPDNPRYAAPPVSHSRPSTHVPEGVEQLRSGLR